MSGKHEEFHILHVGGKESLTQFEEESLRRVATCLSASAFRVTNRSVFDVLDAQKNAPAETC